MIKKIAVILLLLASTAMGQTISDLPAVVDTQIDDETEVMFGVDHSGLNDSYRLDIFNLREVMFRGVVIASGVSATDDARMQAAVASYDTVYIDDSAAALTLGEGTIIYLGSTVVDSVYSNDKARINLTNNSSFQWGDYGNMNSKLTDSIGTNGWTACTVAHAGGVIQTTTQFERGDYIVVAADNDLGINPHFTGGQQRPFEIAKINQKEDGEVADQTARLALTGLTAGVRIYQNDTDVVWEYDGGTISDNANWTAQSGDYEYVLERPLEDTYTSNVRFKQYLSAGSDPLLTTAGGMHNIDLTGSTNSGSTGMTAYHVMNLEMSNVDFKDTGQLALFGCYNARLDRVKCLGQTGSGQDAGDVYGLSITACNNMVVSNFEAQNCRHFITTGGFGASPNRWGTCSGLIIRNAIGYMTGYDTGAVVGFETHPEGLGVRFIDCDVYMGGNSGISEGGFQPVLYGFQTRSRDTHFTHCRVHGSNTEKHVGFRASSSNGTHFIDCEIDGGLVGIWGTTAGSGDPASETITIDSCHIQNTRNNGVVIDGGSNHKIINSTIENCGTSTAGIGGSELALVTFADTDATGTMSGIMVRNNCLSKDINTYSVYVDASIDSTEIEILDNDLRSYDRTSIGLDRSLGNAAELERAYSHKNNDRDRFAIITRSSHGLSVPNEEFNPILHDGTVYDDTVANAGDIRGILVDVINTDTYVLANRGQFVDLTNSLVFADSYSEVSDGSKLYWDENLSKFSASKPGDSADDASDILWVTNYTASTTTVQVMPPEVGASTSGGSSGPSRKEGEDTVAFSNPLTVNFSSGSYDNKRVVMTSSISSMTLTATTRGEYHLVLVQDGTGGRTVVWPANVLWQGSAAQPVAAASTASVFKLYYDGTNFHVN